MTPEELERRRNVVGASEVGLLFGLPSFGGRTIADLWYEKKFGTEKQSKGNASTDLGIRFEPMLLEYAERELKEPVIDRQKWIVNGPNGATLDGRTESGEIIEAKTSGILGPHKLAEWGDDGSDSIPDQYLIQCMTQLLVTGDDLAHLVALIGGRGFAMFKVEKSADFLESLKWDVAPPELPQIDTLKRIRRQPNKILPRSEELDNLCMRFDFAKEAAKEADEDKETLQRQVLAAMGDAEAIEVPGGMLTFYQQSRKEFVTKASVSRVLRFSKGK